MRARSRRSVAVRRGVEGGGGASPGRRDVTLLLRPTSCMPLALATPTRPTELHRNRGRGEETTERAKAGGRLAEQRLLYRAAEQQVFRCQAERS